MTPGAPLLDHRPAAGTCPRCGSASFKRLKAERGAALPNDRECRECGIRYMTIPAPISTTLQTAMYASGLVLILGGVLLVLARLAETQGPPGRKAGSFPLTGVFFSVVAGFGALGMPQRIRQVREERLNKVRTSALPGAPPPVELPQPPDMVSLCILFGILALLSPLFSSLLMVVVFGPAAVVCGVVAFAQGHLKGLIGTALGLVSLIVWGLAFVYFMSG